ncbi:MAG: adenylate kinase [Acidimicrobiales bacterium]|mgnify:FL=1|nr:adenylate kinase [Acidimicrobiales bacterium]MDP6285416.1 adenylate kinase [Acidimicrobiales bacterium]HJL91547.1 adenylate kinase [Acidimicrobiales bacterium]HJO41465.1 adenylate kinase [Acidimicrobiales bacterium]|tara:strand:- start:983 stop:1561 length:579 start_codon:yes stop_codon:yes gene_type:complete
MENLRLVILGRQGSGKGTQCMRLSESYGTIHISTGDILRAAVETQTELGKKAKLIMDAGDLVPDEIINGIVAERIEMKDVLENGFILDGYPRTSAQAQALEGELLSKGLSLDLAINLEVPVDEVTQRMLDRSRADDTEEAITRRLEIYENETAPLLKWFEERNNLVVVDGLGTEDKVFSRLQNVVNGVINGK